jgi:hypothetical protein
MTIKHAIRWAGWMYHGVSEHDGEWWVTNCLTLHGRRIEGELTAEKIRVAVEELSAEPGGRYYSGSMGWDEFEVLVQTDKYREMDEYYDREARG